MDMMDMNHNKWNDDIAPKLEEHLNSINNYSTYQTPNFYMTPEERKFWFEMQERKEKDRELMLARAEVREEIRERDKSIMDVVAIDDRGMVTIDVVNTRKKYATRSGTNFDYPMLTIFINERNGNELYCISVTIGDKEKDIWLGSKDIADAKKMLKKFNSVGADFLTNKVSLKKEYILQLWSVLLRQKFKEIIVPDSLGWCRDCNGKIKFEEDSLTWKDLIKKIEN